MKTNIAPIATSTAEVRNTLKTIKTTTHPRLYAHWIKKDGKMIMKWVSE